jgi:MucR family transcriptional regulator, transcriptional regulator of exopolysaccharide biosynthesis
MITPDADTELEATKLVELTAGLVAAYVSNNAVRATDIPALINDVHAALAGVAARFEETAVATPKPMPAVNPKRSVTGDYIICLEDGKQFKSLKRHLMNEFGLTPDQYRKRWDLEPTYPMVAPNYAATRSQLAKDLGFGRKRKAAGLS